MGANKLEPLSVHVILRGTLHENDWRLVLAQAKSKQHGKQDIWALAHEARHDSEKFGVSVPAVGMRGIQLGVALLDQRAVSKPIDSFMIPALGHLHSLSYHLGRSQYPRPVSPVHKPQWVVVISSLQRPPGKTILGLSGCKVIHQNSGSR